jgi:PAS domain S-box-containing protein
VAAVGIALISIAGWVLGIQPLTSVIPGAVEMKFNTATCILLCGTALFILAHRTGAGLEGLARAMAALAAGVGAATLSEYLFGWQLGIDELVLKDSVGAFVRFHGRMSPFSACAFVILGFAVGAVRIRLLARAAGIAAGLGLAIGLISMIGYLWNADELTTDRWLPPVAINTALCFIVIAIGVFMVERAVMNRSARNVGLAKVELRILIGFAVAISILVVGGSFTYRTSVQLSQSMQWVTHTQEVRTALSDIFGALAGANLVARDYWVTHDPERLREFEGLVAAARARELDLQRLVSDDEQQRRNAMRLAGWLNQALDELDAAMRAFSVYGVEAARATLTVTRGRNAVGRVRDATTAMDEIEAHLVQQREEAAARVRVTTLTSMLLTLAAAIGLFFALFRSIHKEMLARRRAEEDLQDSDEYNRSIIESAPDAVSVLTAGAHVTQMTPRAMELMGIAPSTRVSGTDWCLFWNGEDQQAAREAVAAACSGTPGRFSALTQPPGGIKRWWDVIVMPMRAPKGESQRLLAVARDVSEAKRVESNLLAANRFLDSLIEALPVMVVVRDAADLRIVRVNRLYEKLMGMPAAQLIGKTAFDLLQPAEADLTTKSDHAALAAGAVVELGERTIDTKDGVRILNTTKLPLHDESGNARFLLAISSDITDRKLSEMAIRELNEELEAKATLLESSNKELESFSYSVSHDLRAPLRAIDGFAEMLEEDYGGKLDAEAQRYLAVIRDNSKRMGMLIDDLLAFSRLGRQTVTKAEVAVDSLVREVIAELLHALPPRDGRPAPRIDVGPLPNVRGDRSLLRQVWTNLIANALKYTGKTEQPIIQIGGSAGDHVNEYYVRDNGVGFSMMYVEKLFGVFQRLHRADEFSGTGVGLAIVKRVVERHGGRAWAEGKIDEGAIFSFALPRERGDG